VKSSHNPTFVLWIVLALVVSACRITPPIPPVQVIRYTNRIEPPRETCSADTVPVLQSTDPIDGNHWFQFGDIFLSRDASGPACSVEELEVTLAQIACTEDASLARILRIQTPHTSGSDCHLLRAAIFECVTKEVPDEGDTSDV
jgi:hypothetical protein